MTCSVIAYFSVDSGPSRTSEVTISTGSNDNSLIPSIIMRMRFFVDEVATGGDTVVWFGALEAGVGVTVAA